MKPLVPYKSVLILTATLCISSAGWAQEIPADGFLSPGRAPDSLALLPPPPADNSIAFLADQAAYRQATELSDPQRVQQAIRDADFMHFEHAFSKALGLPISAKHTPRLYHLLQGVLHDSLDQAMMSAKDHYQRTRPFVFFQRSSCTPDQEAMLARNGSYPSGHASFGWATALVLAQINPARADEILRRGYEFGQSRVMCGVHWQSDVTSGRLLGAAVVSALQASPRFAQALEQAQREFARLSARP